MFSTPELPGSDSVGMISAPSEGTPNSSNQATKLEITSELRKFTPKSVQWKNAGGQKQKHKKTAFWRCQCFAPVVSDVACLISSRSLNQPHHITNATLPSEGGGIAKRLFFMFLFLIPFTIRQQSIIYPHKFSTDPPLSPPFPHKSVVKPRLFPHKSVVKP